MPQIQKIKDLTLLDKMLTAAELHLARVKKDKNPSEKKVKDLENDISQVFNQIQGLKNVKSR